MSYTKKQRPWTSRLAEIGDRELLDLALEPVIWHACSPLERDLLGRLGAAQFQLDLLQEQERNLLNALWDAAMGAAAKQCIEPNGHPL